MFWCCVWICLYMGNAPYSISSCDIFQLATAASTVSIHMWQTDWVSQTSVLASYEWANADNGLFTISPDSLPKLFAGCLCWNSYAIATEKKICALSYGKTSTWIEYRTATQRKKLYVVWVERRNYQCSIFNRHACSVAEFTPSV